MKAAPSRQPIPVMSYLLSLLLLVAFGFWLASVKLESSWQRAGLVNFSLGVVLLAAYICAQVLKRTRLPLISGYILAGIVAGPHVTGFLSDIMVQKLRLVDDLALSFIALSAGGALQLQFLVKRRKTILLNVTVQTLLVFGLVFLFIVTFGSRFSFTRALDPLQLYALAILLGVVALARSPSSAIAIISECRASGVFTETVLGITVAMDVLIIIFFTVALALTRIMLTASAMMDYQAFLALSLEMVASIILGMVSGRGIAWYIEQAGHDLPLFLLFYAFGATKAALWLSHFMQDHFHLSLHLEPLLICMSAGFTVQNFSKSGSEFMESLGRVSLPIYVLFFSLAGASLNLQALRITWAIAVCLALVRATGIFGAAWLSGTLSGDPPRHNRVAWMAYLTQAGVAIGLAQLSQRHFPEIGLYLATVVLAVITINQIVGPVTFKVALNLVGEARQR